jgi:hypothetical protein
VIQLCCRTTCESLDHDSFQDAIVLQAVTVVVGSGVELAWGSRRVAAGLVEEACRVTVDASPGPADECAAGLHALSLADTTQDPAHIQDTPTIEDTPHDPAQIEPVTQRPALAAVKHEPATCTACTWARHAGERIGGLGLELSRATHVIDDALRHGPRHHAACSGMLISGPAGVGKTAMIDALLATSPCAPPPLAFGVVG